MGVQVDPMQLFHIVPPIPVTHMGRALAATPVLRSPNTAVIAHLWPDSVVPIQASTTDGWYKLAEGYVLKSALQPMALAETPPQVEQPTFWAEVTAPAAAVRQFCAVDAPLVTRIGHGGVAQVIDLLPGEPSWYGVADENGALLGWTQTVHWRRVEDIHDAAPYHLEIDQQRQILTIYQNQIAGLRAPISIGKPLTPGIYPLQRGSMGSGISENFHGVPWQIHIGGGYNLNGVYWHNQFGSAMPGSAVQVTPILARWLYQSIGDNGFVTIV